MNAGRLLNAAKLFAFAVAPDQTASEFIYARKQNASPSEQLAAVKKGFRQDAAELQEKIPLAFDELRRGIFEA